MHYYANDKQETAEHARIRLIFTMTSTASEQCSPLSNDPQPPCSTVIAGPRSFGLLVKVAATSSFTVGYDRVDLLHKQGSDKKLDPILAIPWSDETCTKYIEELVTNLSSTFSRRSSFERVLMT
jgi:hypothetical protein